MVTAYEHRPRIGLTMGDPAGIGPELIARCLADEHLRRTAQFVVYGDPARLSMAQHACGVSSHWQVADTVAAAADAIVVDSADCGDVCALAAEPTRRGGHASKVWVEHAITDAMSTGSTAPVLDAVVTAPISKLAWDMAGYAWPGHTELFASRTRAKRCCMVFASPNLRVALATVHIPLMTLRDVLTIGRVFDPIDLGAQACRDLGIERPRIAVCGLNPHAGEGGLLGDEDSRIITPAIAMAREHGIDAHGPFPADTIFSQAVVGRWDMVVAMYHDQGLLPLKLTSQGTAVNWSVGLPIIRTSPDHGTAYDIAGQGVASSASMCSAIELAVQLARRRACARTDTMTAP